MKRLSCFMLDFGIVVAFLSLTIILAFAQFPDPKDEAKLYELAKKEGTLVWYGGAALPTMRDIANDFEAKYPGIKTEILRFSGVAQYQRFLFETKAKQYIADNLLYLTDYPSMKSLMEQGHLAEWKVPTFNRFPAPFRLGNHGYVVWISDIAVVYNVNKVTPEEVKILDNSWKGVLDPRFKGRFVVSTSKVGTTYIGIHMFLDPKNEKVFGPDFIKAVASQKPTVYGDSQVALERVIAGEHDFTYWSWESIAFQKWVQGAPIRWIHPDPTPVAAMTWNGISKYAPHPNAARLFMNWLTSEEGALSLQNMGYNTSLEGMKDTRKLLKEPWYDPIKTRYYVDFERWQKNYIPDLDFWIKTMTESR